MKDNFSAQSAQYAKYRPAYPSDLFTYINSLVQNRENAWDCGTGNGQVAYELAKTFKNVFATDISQSQLDNALQADNLRYSVQPAEKTYFKDCFFDLIVAAQAIHWFDFESFYSEVRRTARKSAWICVIGYGRIRIDRQIDKIITDFYKNILSSHWDKERKYIDQNYKTIPFPFSEIQTPNFVNKLHWTREHFIGYLNTWSAVKHFIRQNKLNPVRALRSDLEQLWLEDQVKEVQFPLLLRIGRI